MIVALLMHKIVGLHSILNKNTCGKLGLLLENRLPVSFLAHVKYLHTVSHRIVILGSDHIARRGLCVRSVASYCCQS